MFCAMPPSTTEEIANRIVSLGSKGMWILTMDGFDRTGEWTDGVEIEPYQHNSNLPNPDRLTSQDLLPSPSSLR